MPSPTEALILVVGGAAAGFVNTLAGGGSFLTVPLLILVGLPPTVANATNRVAVFAQNCAAIAGFRQEGFSELRPAARVLPATLVGAALGAWLAALVPERPFELAFGAIMLGMLPILLRNPQPGRPDAEKRLPPPLEFAVYLGVGFYGGAIQAGVGIPLLFSLVLVGRCDLVHANSVKVVIIAALTAVALALFIIAGKVVFTHGLVLAGGSAVGGYLASRIGARVGERLIRPVLAVMVVVLAIRLLVGAGSLIPD